MKHKLAVIALALITSACSQTTIRQSPEFANSWNKTYSVSLLPPEAKVQYLQFDSDDKRMPEDETKAVTTINTETPKLLREKNYEVKDMNFAAYQATHPDAAFQLERLKQATKKAMGEMYKTQQMSEEEAFKMNKSVSAEANLFADLAKTDLLLYIDYQGFEKSDAMVAKDIAAGVLFAVLTGSAYVEPMEGSVVQAALIDGTTGNILWANSVAASSKKAEGPLKTVLEKLPNKSGAKPKD